MTSTAIVERNLAPLRPQCEALVTPVGLDARRFMFSIIAACERNPRLLDFPPEQHQLAAWSAMTLGLEPDGFTGQLFLIPFGGRKPVIQPVTGYKGLNTVAARAGITILGDELREGDEFSTELVAGRPFAVRQRFGGRQNAPVVGAWAQAMLPNGGYTSPVLMDMSAINAVRKKSRGAAKPDSPWNDADGPGFGAMCAKTAKRRLQRSLPMILTRGLEPMNISQHGLAMAMDQEHEDIGRHSWIGSDMQVHSDDALPEPTPDDTPYRFAARDRVILCRSADDWRARWKAGIAAAPSAAAIEAVMGRNAPQFAALIDAGCVADVEEIRQIAAHRKEELA